MAASRTAVILNSRQSKTPSGGDEWVKSTVQAVNYCVENDLRIVGSVGMNTWELLLWGISEFKGKGSLILPSIHVSTNSILIEGVCHDYRMEKKGHNWNFLVPSNPRSRKSWWDERDRYAIKLSDTLIPVSVREGGRLDALLIESGNRKVVTEFRIEYSSKSICGESWKVPEITCQPDGWDYLTHWTSRSYVPWNNEDHFAYYKSIIDCVDEYSHSALRALINIIEQNYIFGSTGRYRGGKSAVSFTELSPAESAPLMRWRSRFVRPTFEPYGIAIAKSAALHAGIKKVEYFKNGAESCAINEKGPYTQGYSKGEWWREKEWRYIGDLDLGNLPPDSIKILVPKHEDVLRFGVVDYDFIPICGLD
ncbi:MAG TPA: hypothetical protein VGB30_04640 [bacterium]|jgi:hypothetical protein